MVAETVRSALDSLISERDRLNSAIASLEDLISSVGGSSMRAGRRGRRRGRLARAMPGRPGRPAGRRRRKNAPRGLLKAKIHEVLKSRRKPLKPVDLRNLVIEAGYPVKNPKTLYTAIFAAAKGDPAIKKTKAGFRLK